MDWSTSVQSGFFDFLKIEGLVTVLVKGLEVKKLDWTGLPNTMHNRIIVMMKMKKTRLVLI